MVTLVWLITIVTIRFSVFRYPKSTHCFVFDFDGYCILSKREYWILNNGNLNVLHINRLIGLIEHCTINPEYMAANKDCERQRQTMAKVESHPMKESPMNANAGPTCPIVLKSFRVFWTDNHFIRMIFGQFHQHFTHGFFVWKFCAQVTF